MIEARIECLCSEFKINDLDLVLVRGDVRWVPKAKADASSELKHARSIKAVDVRFIKRGETVDPSRRVPWIHGKNKGRQPVKRPDRSAPAPAPTSTETPASSLTAEEVRKITQEEMRKARAEMRAEVGAEVRKALSSRDGDSLSKDDVADVLREVLGSMPVAAAPAPRQVGPGMKMGAPAPVAVVEEEDPVFIPSNIGASVNKAEINVEAGESAASESFEETAKAMKEAAASRPKRARKPRKSD